MKKDKHDPYENRTKCYSCKTKGYLKIIKNENTNEYIKTALESELIDYRLVFFDFIRRLECMCQKCGHIDYYDVEEGLFVDGVIKEI